MSIDTGTDSTTNSDSDTVGDGRKGDDTLLQGHTQTQPDNVGPSICFHVHEATNKPVEAPKLDNIVQVEFLVLEALSAWLAGDVNVERTYMGTKYSLPLRNGQTAVVTVDVKTEDKQNTR